MKFCELITLAQALGEDTGRKCKTCLEQAKMQGMINDEGKLTDLGEFTLLIALKTLETVHPVYKEKHEHVRD